MNQRTQHHDNGGYHSMPATSTQAPDTQVQTPVTANPNQRQQQSRTGGSNRHQAKPMPQAKSLEHVQEILQGAKASFEKIVTSVGLDVKFYEEAVYARQLIENNHNNARNKNFSLAQATPESIRNALIQVANSGLTLNPQLELAYLVPRWNGNAGHLECHLEPSYRGLHRLGIDCGAIDTAVAELVYENDDFKWNDSFTKPDHNFDPFNPNRGKLRGGYCLARRP